MSLLFTGCGPASDTQKENSNESESLHVYTSDDVEVNASQLSFPQNIEHVLVEPSDGRYKFLHDPAIIRHKNELIAAWYSCPEQEITDESSIRARRSTDGGRTWSNPEVVAEDKEKTGLHYVPAQLLSHQGKLYAFVGTMTGHDRIVNTMLYNYNEDGEVWEEIGEVAKLFLPNTTPVRLKNGSWMIAGRVAASPGSLPLIPAVLISSGDDLEKPWRVVRLQNDEFTNGIQHPETTVIARNNDIYAFTRVNESEYTPAIYVSNDYGETWTKIANHDFTSVPAKMYAGTLSTGQGYIVFNYPAYETEQPGLEERSILAIAVSKDNRDPFVFSKIYKIQSPGPGKPSISHYPTAMESEGKVYVVYTAHFDGESKRQCELAIIPIESIK